MKLNLSTNIFLVIEDYPVMRKSIRDMLHTLGAQYIFEAENGTAALSAMKKRKFDIILCDYHLGIGKNGQQILEQARHNKLISFDTIFIIVSAHQTASLVLSTIEHKPDEYLAKPFNPQQLLRRLEKSASRKKHLSIIENDIEKGNLAHAIFHCENLLNNNKNAPRSQLLKIRAELAIKVGDFKKASAIYKEILQQRDLSWSRQGLGIIAFLQNNYEQAISIFQKLIEQKPMEMECYDWLAKSQIALNQISQAEETLSKATEISPNSFFRQKKLAILADQNSNFLRAEKAYIAVTELGKYSIHKAPSDFSGLAKVYLKEKKTKQAFKTLDTMRQQFVNNPEAELRAATVETEAYKIIKNNDASSQAFQKVQQLKNQLEDDLSKDLQLDIAKTCLLNNDTETADEIITSLVQNYIDDDVFINNIRQMQSEMGTSSNSEILIEKTRQDLLKINNQGVKLFQQGQSKEAYAVFLAAEEKMPKNKTIIYNLAKITLHELKKSGVTQENLLLAQQAIKKAEQVGIASDKLGGLQLEFDNLTRTQTILQ